MADKDYVLGTHDEEISRLGLQHLVWRSRTAAVWERAGIDRGSRVLDVGAGPGFATSDLAEVVGSSGEVVALERSQRFIAYGRDRLASLGLGHARFRPTDLVTDDFGATGYDAAWCRWVLSFVSDPRTVVAKVAGALRPGGRFVVHEYLDYGTWTFLPPRPPHTRFVEAPETSWRETGGEPDIGRVLPSLLSEAGFSLTRVEPVVFSMKPGTLTWQWPAAFINGSALRLAEQGHLSREEAEEAIDDFAEAQKAPGAVMVSPMVVEIVAVRD
ncbi:MAG: methyltransferase domain-containing protein [Armatimonadetes bacterium]|nr:methyltransferase domain-containing protein [Armatimonadota bacterium]